MDMLNGKFASSMRHVLVQNSLTRTVFWKLDAVYSCVKRYMKSSIVGNF